LRWPERVGALALLCPAVAWLRRSFHPIVRLLRPEFGLLPHGFRRSIVTSHLRSIFCDEASIDPALADLAVDEFRRIYRSPWARRAFLASARNIYLDAPFGRDGFYPRLARLERPALFVWGSHDRVVPPAFGRHVRRWLPEAEQVTIGSCGHVPQIEHPAEINEVLMRFFARSERAAAGSRALPDSRAA
jgi:pimeloyl-ACP methyl ester carboxylesterase